MFLTAVLVGMIFSQASQLRLKRVVRVASDVYSVDLAGAAIGSFLVTVYLIPLLGVLNVCLVVGGFMLLGAALTMLKIR
jgi:predicted membrane-bound spermidine synthase